MDRIRTTVPRFAGDRLRGLPIADVSIGLADQAVVSLTNFVTMLLLARVLVAPDFGKFTLVYGVLLFAGVLQATLITQPHNVIGASLKGAEYARYTAATGLSQLAYAGVITGLTIVAAAAARGVDPEISTLLIALAPAIMAWQLQEFIRRVLYTERRQVAAFANDAASYGGQAIAIFVLSFIGRLNGESALYAVAATSAVAVIVGVYQIRGSLAFPAAGVSAVRDNVSFGKWLAGAEIGYWLSTQTYVYLAAAILGPAGAGLLKAVQLLFGPLNVILFFLNSTLPVRFASAYARTGRSGLDRQARRAYALIVPVVVSYCVAVTALGAPLLNLLYGDTYAGGGSVVGLFGLFYLVVTPFAVLSGALRALRRTRPIFIAYLLASVTSVSLGWLLVARAGVEGAAAGMALSLIIVTIYCALAYIRPLAVARPGTDENRPIAKVPLNLPGPTAGLEAPATVPDVADDRLLTLACLFPKDIDLRSVGAPPRFRAIFERARTPGGHRVIGVWGSAFPSGVDIEAARGLILVNSSLGVEDVRALGFAYVREYAVVPGLDDPRWFIPLEGGRVAAAAFRIYAPYRIKARLQHAAALAAARTRTLRYRARICVAWRSVPPMEETLREVLGLPSIAVGFVAGSSTRRPKPVFVALDTNGRALAFGKPLIDELRRPPMQREALALRTLSAVAPGIAPTLLFEGEAGGYYLTLQSALPGSRGPRSLSSMHSRFLATLSTGPEGPLGATEMLRTLERRLESEPRLEPTAELLVTLRPRIDDLVVRRTITHGDFAPWNVRQSAGSIAAFDWEDASLDGLPLIDALHHSLQVGLLLNKWNLTKADECLMSFAAEPRRSIDREGACILEALYLMDQAARVVESGGTPFVHTALLRRVAARLTAA